MKFIFISHGIPEKAKQQMTELVGKNKGEARVVYITTAANTYPPNPEWLLEAKTDLQDIFPNLEELDLEKAYKEKVDLKKYFTNVDAVFFSGGNTFYLLYWMKKSGLDVLLRELLERGVVYGGESAGVVCQVEDLTPIAWLDEPEKAPEVVEKGLMYTDLVVIPHWNNPKYKEPLEKAKKYYEDKGIEVKTLEDNQVMFVVNGKVEKVS